MSFKDINGVYLADTARVMGDVTLGKGTNVWYSAVIRGDVAAIILGDEVNVQDGCVLHCDAGHALTIGNRVTIGHGAIVHCREVGDGTLIGMGARVLGGVKIGKGCLVAAGAVVPPNLVVPDNSMVVGVPGRILRATKAEEKAYLAQLPSHYVKLAHRYTYETDETTVLYGS